MKKSHLVTFGILAATLALAQSYSIDWATMGSGGGTTTGGVYSVSSTIGQTATGKASGGVYNLDGGFWSIIAAIQTPGAPELTIARSGGNVTISWPSSATGFSLQQNITLNPANWSSFGGTVNDNGINKSVTIASPPGRNFFRLIQQ